jgi:hypothetical protein
VVDNHRFNVVYTDASRVGGLMPSSLKGYVPALARVVGLTAAALYERQRALVRAGLLDTTAGRGPGSGTRATAPAVALLLIATLASDSLTETEKRARDIANAAPIKADRRPLKDMNFRDALASTLCSKSRSRSVSAIGVSRTADRAWITYKDGKTSNFAGPEPTEPGLRIEASLAGEVLARVADDVLAIINAKFEQQERALAAAANPTETRKAS